MPKKQGGNDILTNTLSSPGLFASSLSNNTEEFSSVTNASINVEKITQPVFLKNTFNGSVVPSASLNISPTDITSLVNVVIEIKL